MDGLILKHLMNEWIVSWGVIRGATGARAPPPRALKEGKKKGKEKREEKGKI